MQTGGSLSLHAVVKTVSLRVADGHAIMDRWLPEDSPMATAVRVLFVCVENANRSQMAEAFARLLGGKHVEAYSAGSDPSGQVNPKAIASMQELGYDLSAHGSISVDDLPDVRFDFVATMGCGDTCPTVQAKQRVDWAIPDPRHLSPGEFRVIRDMIRDKVASMLRELGIPVGGIDTRSPQVHLQGRSTLSVSCHCGNLKIEVSPPTQVTRCNCSICSRYQALWGYYDPDEVVVSTGPAGEDTYIWGDKMLEFVRCANCGCVSYYRMVPGTPDPKVGVNFRMLPEEQISEVPVRHFNGRELL